MIIIKILRKYFAEHLYKSQKIKMQKTDLQRWEQRKNKNKPKDKSRVQSTLTEHALRRAEQREVRVKDIVEGRAAVKQVTKDGRFLTIIPL